MQFYDFCQYFVAFLLLLYYFCFGFGFSSGKEQKLYINLLCVEQPMSIETTATVVGVLPSVSSVAEMRELLKLCGLTSSTGDTHHVSVQECSYFVFRETGKNEFLLGGDAETLEQMLKETEFVSTALARKKVTHKFEVYDSTDKLAKEYEFPST
jgi:hypothetical protein